MQSGDRNLTSNLDSQDFDHQRYFKELIEHSSVKELVQQNNMLEDGTPHRL
jgi:hypothetical protein